MHCAMTTTDIWHNKCNSFHCIPFSFNLSDKLKIVYNYYNLYEKNNQIKIHGQSIMSELFNVKGFLLDMDGTFYLGDQLLPGALEFLDFLDGRAIPFMFLTNNSSKSKLEYQQKLISMGVKPHQAQVYTSGDATGSYLSKDPLVRKAYVVGTQGLIDTFNSLGVVITDEDPDVVVLGFDTSLTYAKICKLCEFIVRGKTFIATHFDINCPTPTGFIPDVGSMLAMIKASTGREPDIVVGKPNKMIVEMIVSEMGRKIEDCAMVGDRLYTDIAMGATSGIKTILMLTGETSCEDLAESKFTPDFVFRDLNELREQFN